MEKKHFHNLLINYTSLTREETEMLLSLEKEFPYSQVIHSLAARATQDNQLAEKEEQLHLGAIYTTDRAVFKSIMMAPSQERKPATADFLEEKNPETTGVVEPMIEQIQEITPTLKVVEIAEVVFSEEPKTEAPILSNKDFTLSDSFYDQIAFDLQKLKEVKHVFEETAERYENGTLAASPDSEKNQKKKSKSVDPTDELLTEIKSSKKKVKPEGPKQKEQIEIIEQFIKTQPSIKGKVASEEKSVPKDDLSEKSLQYSENIISETLVEILTKQGKKEKAIEVLKKLIWKFPQKKAYFAAQIEELKK